MKKRVLGLLSTAIIVFPAHAYNFVMPASNYVAKQVDATTPEKALLEKPFDSMQIKSEGSAEKSKAIAEETTVLRSVVPAQQKIEKVKPNRQNKAQPSVHLNDLQGRYALDCAVNKSHNLSYVISNTQITRLISAKKKQSVAQELKSKAVKHQDFEYLSTALYQGFKVDFYQKDGKHFAKVKSRSISNFYGPKTKELLQQCSSVKS